MKKFFNKHFSKKGDKKKQKDSNMPPDCHPSRSDIGASNSSNTNSDTHGDEYDIYDDAVSSPDATVENEYRNVTTAKQPANVPPKIPEVPPSTSVHSSLRKTYTLKSVNKPDMLGLDDEGPVYEMSCGHAISSKSLVWYCEDLLKKGKVEFACADPRCKSIWEYPEIRTVAKLNQDQMKHFETTLSSNTQSQDNDLRQCPSCFTPCCRRDEIVTNCIRCDVCTEVNGKAYDFCWQCLQPWKNSDSPCTNSNCVRQTKLENLANCSEKTVMDIKCPSIRACPKCYALVQYKDQCKHIPCSFCHHNFCFICLRPSNPEDAGELLEGHCGGVMGCKTVASRQTADDVHG